MSIVDIGDRTIAPYFLHTAPLFGFITLLNTASLRDFTLTNAIIQSSIFIFSAQIPSYFTGIMSWVDLAWPSGLVAIAMQTYYNVDPTTNPWRTNIGALLYLLQGGRMALGATSMVISGHMKREMPRYQYQKIRWAKRGIHKGSALYTLMMQKEIFMQAYFNFGGAVVPGILIANNKLKDAPLQAAEYVGILLWLFSYYIEHTSDLQKVSFLKRMKKEGVRNSSMTEKLWSISRHPNYLGEWMCWLSLTIYAFPSLKSFIDSQDETTTGKIMLSMSLAICSMSMYFCLTWWTGATPAEYFSLQKRKGYKEYMKRVPQLIPRIGDVISYIFGSKK